MLIKRIFWDVIKTKLTKDEMTELESTVIATGIIRGGVMISENLLNPVLRNKLGNVLNVHI